MPIEAEALCRTLVSSMPASTPSRGLENAVTVSRKTASSFSGATAPLMALMPNISTANPIRISPRCTTACRFPAIRRMMPATAITPVSVAVDKRSIQPPLRADSATIHPVILVPRIAPITIPIAWRTFIIPELTKPTTITEVAEEDWITAVTPVPSRMPLRGVLLKRYSTSSSLLPATFFKFSPMNAMPNKNSATPPRSAI